MPNDAAQSAANRTRLDDWFTPGRLTLLLALFIFAVFPGVITGRDTFFYRDYGLFTYPIAHYYRECFWHGELPLWNPYNDCGVPLLAQWNTAMLYPPSLFYLLLPLPWSLGVFNLAHLCFAGLGMYFLARRWTDNRLAAAVAAVAFAFNGLSFHMVMWISNLAAYAWMPWVVSAVERAWREGGRKIVWAALAGAMQMLAGAPEIILLTWGALAVIWLLDFRRGEFSRARMCGRVFGVVLLVAGLSAAQLLPFADLLRHSQRDAGYADSKWAMPGWGWANFILPLFHCSPSIAGVYSQNEQQWTSSYYLGIGLLALALVAVFQRRQPGRVYVLALLAVAGVVLSMGENTFLYAGLRRVFPMIGVMRYPIKIAVLTAFVLPLLAAYGAKGCLEPAGEHVRPRRRLLIVGGVLAVTLIGILASARRFPLADDSWPVELENGIARAVFLAAILGALCFLARPLAVRAAGLTGWALLLLLGLDALMHTSNQNPTVPAVAAAPQAIDLPGARLGESRVMLHPRLGAFLFHAALADPVAYYTGLRGALYLDANLIDRVPVIGGFFSVSPRESAQVDAALGNPANTFPEPLADFLGVSRISGPEMPPAWITRSNSMPLATAGQRPIFAGADETLKGILSAGFDPRATVYLPAEMRGSVTVTNAAPARILSQKFSAQAIELETQADAPALVVVAQTYYHGWRAYLDGPRGTPTRVLRANHAFQAVEIPAGRHTVWLVYDDARFRLGILISGVTLVILVVVAFRWKAPATPQMARFENQSLPS